MRRMTRMTRMTMMTMMTMIAGEGSGRVFGKKTNGKICKLPKNATWILSSVLAAKP
jgi:hypothetical protein